jgi:S-adenosylmethionine:tRNA ribosyltransferase-isomerase
MLCEGRELIPGSIHMDQWEHEELVQEIPLRESLHALIRFCRDKGINPFRFTTQLMITPGYSFKTISGLITNYHLPGSTLLLLIAAFLGDDWKKVYAEALEKGYRFLSYGDSSMLLP